MGVLLGLLMMIGHGIDTSTVHASDLSTDDLKTLAASIAAEHHLNTAKFLSVIECESGWDAAVVGDHGTSFGLVQLHHPQRDWDITPDQAFEPIRAMEIMASAWEKGQQKRWSCY